MKRILCFFLPCAILAALAACGGRDDGTPSESTDSGPENAAASSPDFQDTSDSTDAPAPTASGKPLIVYFTADENAEPDAVSSASIVSVDGTEKGHVRAVADIIAAETGGALFALTTETRYPADRDGVIE